MRANQAIILLIILVSFGIGIYLYPSMPEKMASHWNEQGQVNGYMPKFWGIFLMPIMTVALLALFWAIPLIDPLKENIKKFRNYFDSFILVIMAFFFYIYLLSLLWNMGFRYNMMQLMAPALAALFYYMGVLMQYSKRNWSIGIRTRWTLSSDTVWEKTHKIGAKLFKVSGIIALLGIVFPDIAIWLVLVPVLATTAYTIAYSYFEYQKETSKSAK